MASAQQVNILVSVFVVLVITAEYIYIATMWRYPVVGYRVLLSTITLLALCTEVDMLLGKEYLAHVPRTVIFAITVNFTIFEHVMCCKMKAYKKSRATVDTEHALVEDLACEV